MFRILNQYRAYSQNTVIEIERDKKCVDGFAKSRSGFVPVETHVYSYPEKCPARPDGGMFLLSGYPLNPMEPAPFVDGSREGLEATLTAVEGAYGELCPDIVESWRHFVKHEAPQSNNVYEHVQKKPLEIPFFPALFAG